MHSFALSGDGYQSGALEVRWGRLTPAELSEAQAALPPSTVGPAYSARDALLASVAARMPDALVAVSVQLADAEKFGVALASQDIAARQTSVAQRKQRLAPAQGAFETAAAAFGATGFSRSWLVNQVTFDMPAGQVAQAMKALGGEWFEVSYHVKSTARWAQDRVRNQSAFDTYNIAGYSGYSGSRSSGLPVRIGIVEGGTPLSNWVSWDHPGLSTGRLLNARSCQYGPGCVETPSILPTFDTHGTAVTAIAAGSIEGGSDPSVPSLSERIRRSGLATTATMHYYAAADSVEFRRAVEDSVALGLDVVNYSAITCAEDCPAAGYNCDGINEAIRAALDAGTLVVAATGNTDHNQTACRVGYPAMLPETVGVSGFNSIDDTKTLAQSPMGYGARGGIPMRLHTGTSGTYSGVDILAPSHHRFAYGLTGTANAYKDFDGSSAAAPVISAAVALLKNAYYGLNTPPLVIGAKHVVPHLLVFGDSFDWVNDTTANTYAYKGLDVVSGAGRIRMRLPFPGTYGAGPSGWGWSSYTMINGARRIGTLTTPFKHHKYAMTWYGESTASLSNLDVFAFKVCGGTRTEIRRQNDLDVRNRLHTRDVDVPAGCSLDIEVQAVSVPAGASVTVYDAWLWHNEVLP